MNREERILNDLYLFYLTFIGSRFKERYQAPHIKRLSRELMKMYRGDYQRLCVAMPPRHKLADSTLVLTSNRGWVNHGDLVVGDMVFTPNGESSEVVGVSEKDYCDYKVTFTDGSEILAHSGHLWSVYKRGGKKQSIHTTDEIMEDYVYYEGNKRRYRYQLPLIKPLQYPSKELPIDPYWLGLWLGDGTYNKPCITHASEDNEWIKHVPYKVSSVSIHNKTGVHTTYFSNQGLIEKIRELNLYENKHIPELYFTASVEDRLKLLAGLIDSDGSVDKKGRVRFTNTNKKLIEGFAQLCDGLGLYHGQISCITAEEQNRIKSEKEYGLPIVSKKDCYCVGFQATYPIPTRIPRKACTGKGLRRRLSIINVEKVNDGEMGKCIEIADPEGVYLVGERLIPTHNSKSAMITLAYPLWLLAHNPNLNILIINAEAGLSEKFGIDLRESVLEYGELFGFKLSDVKHAKNYLMFEDLNGNLLNGSIRLVGSGGSITGHDADYIILDDPYKGFDDIVPSQLDKKIDWFNTIVEQRIEPHTRLIILHTKWSNNDIQGYLYRKQHDKYRWISFPAITKKGEPLWPQRYTLEELEDKRRAMGDRLFESIYQQTPLDLTSDFFDLEQLRFNEEPENIIASIWAYDLAYSEVDNADYTVGIKMLKSTDDTYYITDMIRGKYGNRNKEIVLRNARSDPDTPIGIEFGVAAAGKLLAHEWKSYLHDYIVKEIVPIRNKEDRAFPLSNTISDGKLVVNLQGKKLEDWMREIASFPEGVHDDIVDASAHAYNLLRRKRKHNLNDYIIEI